MAAKPQTLDDRPILFFASRQEWEAWLSENSQQVTGVWIKFAKKDSGITSLHYDQALEGVLCFGWIDGQSKTLDDVYYLQKFTPRRSRSMWSKRNVGIVTRLMAEGRVKPSGLHAVEAAKKDGRWEQAYDSSTTMVMPAEFQAALDKSAKAKAFYETLNKANIYAFLYRIQTAKQDATKQRRIRQFVQMLEEGKKFH